MNCYIIINDGNQTLSVSCRKLEEAIETLNKEKQASDRKSSQVSRLLYHHYDENQTLSESCRKLEEAIETLNEKQASDRKSSQASRLL